MKALAVKALVIHARDRVVELHRRIRGGARSNAPAARTTVLPEAVEFQDGVDEVIKEPFPRFLDSSHYFVVLLFLILVLIAAVIETDVVLTGGGRLITDTPTFVVQTLERGIIRELNIKPGLAVTKGQVLATMDPTFARADLASVAIQQQAAQAQQRRLEAELAGSVFDTAGIAPDEAAIQSTLYRQRQAEYASRLDVFDEDILRLRASIVTAQNGRAVLEKELEVAKEVENLRTALTKSQAGSKLQLLEASSSRMRAEREYQEMNNRLLELRHGVDSKEAERQAFIDEWRRQLMESLVTARAQVASTAEGLAKASRIHDLVVLTAPADGVILDVAKLSVGSVLRDAETLATIVPANATLIAEIMIGSDDIGYVKVGETVSIKMDAFAYLRHGLLTGRLISVSAESFSASGPGGEPPPTPHASSGGGVYYRGWVELVNTKLEHMPASAKLLPGMTLTAEIRIGKRTILSYLLSPIIKGLSDSFKEP